jgi:iron complex outermembrane recepter protein
MPNLNKNVRHLAVALLIANLHLASLAQDARDASELQAVTVIGTRASPRTAVDSMAPVDIISRTSIEQTAVSTLTDALADLVPSFNVQTLPALDATIFVRPARLRNLSPDQTLVLINGKRMHRSAMMMNPSYGSAFQAPDLDQIATSSLKSIEVLRDGASAQYGSDAIAGVINLNLDDSLDWRGFAQTGKYFAGDGADTRVGLHGGLGDKKAFFAMTAEYTKDGYTSRSVQSSNAAASQAAFPTLQFPNPDVNWGSPSRDALRLAFNSAIQMEDKTLYSFGTYGQGSGVGDFNYRGPSGSYASLFANNSAFPGWNLKQVYPTGFTPHFKSTDDDFSFYFGLKSNTDSDADALKWDLSYGLGKNNIQYSMSNSINASLGPNSPTSFDDGGVHQTEHYINFDVSKPIALTSYEEPAVWAAGVELKNEIFSISAGDPASYAFGPGAPSLSCCSSGFPGYSPLLTGVHQQGSKALYADLYLPLTQRFSLDGALRYENYDSFGDSLTHKLSSKLDFKPFALRASLSNGFRAPTTAQIYSEGLSQYLPSATSPIATVGRFSPVGPVAALLNNRPGVAITALKPETSNNISFGTTWDLEHGYSGSLDFFKIDVNNRLNASSTYTLTPSETAALNATNIPNLQNVSQANFLQNNFNTTTQGVELVLQDSSKLASGKLNSSLALSVINTKVNNGSITANPYAKQVYEDSLPKNRATLSSTYSVSSWDVMGRVRYYGAWTDWTDAFPSTATPGATYPTYNPQVFSAITFADLSVGYSLDKNTKITVGADNIFNTYPDKSRYQTFRGLVYSRNSPYSTNGGFYYARISAKF